MTHRFLDLSIAQRLAIGFGLIFSIVVLVLFVFLSWHERSSEAQLSYSEHIAPLRDGVHALERDIYQVGVFLRSALLSPEEERIQAYRTRATDARTTLELLTRSPMEADESALFREVENITRRFVDQADETLAARFSPDVSIAEESELLDLREQFLASTSAFILQQEEQAAAALAVIAETRDAINRGLAVLSITVLSALTAVAFVTARSISGPSQQLLRTAVALKRGDWKPALRLAPETPSRLGVRDEMRRIGYAFGSAAVALEQREQRLVADRAVARAVASHLQREALSRSALRDIVKHVRAEIGVIYTTSADGGVLRPGATHGLNAEPVDIECGDGLPGQAARDRSGIVIDDIPEDAPFQVKLGYDQAPVKAVAAIPLLFQDTLHGVLLVGSLRRFSNEAIGFLEASATQLGIGLQNVTSHEETERLLEEVQASNERIQAQNEELQVQNEEIQAQNEELQAQSQQLQAQHEEIQAQNEELTQQSAELRRHAELLAEADERKNHFLAVLAHELRNPMGPILNGLYVLQRSDPGSERAQRAREVIDRQVGHMVRLIDDLLDLTRISQGKIRVEKDRLNLVDVVRHCVEDLAGALDEANIDLDLNLPATSIDIEGDHTRLCQVLGNLLHNAIKFGRKGGCVKLSVDADREARMAHISVSDDGVGMDASLLPMLFEPFMQGDSQRVHEKGGLGLGLALVKALVALHGGTVEAHSDGVGQGALFRVRLPIAKFWTGAAQTRSDAATEKRDRRHQKVQRILVIEDNVDAARTLREALEVEGYEVRVAHTGMEGIECAETFKPELVLCDIGLPGCDGYQVARELRTKPATASAILIALTGYASASDKEQAEAAGFDLHFAKPLRISVLNDVVATLRPVGMQRSLTVPDLQSSPAQREIDTGEDESGTDEVVQIKPLA